MQDIACQSEHSEDVFVRWLMLKQNWTGLGVCTVARPMCSVRGLGWGGRGLAWIVRAWAICRKYSCRSLSRRWWACQVSKSSVFGMEQAALMGLWSHFQRSNKCVGYEQEPDYSLIKGITNHRTENWNESYGCFCF